MAQVRTRPTLCDETSPALSNTARCCITDGKDIGRGRASSLTGAGLRVSRATMARLAGSARAWKM